MALQYYALRLGKNAGTTSQCNQWVITRQISALPVSSKVKFSGIMTQAAAWHHYYGLGVGSAGVDSACVATYGSFPRVLLINSGGDSNQIGEYSVIFIPPLSHARHCQWRRGRQPTIFSCHKESCWKVCKVSSQTIAHNKVGGNNFLYVRVGDAWAWWNESDGRGLLLPRWLFQ